MSYLFSKQLDDWFQHWSLKIMIQITHTPSIETWVKNNLKYHAGTFMVMDEWQNISSLNNTQTHTFLSRHMGVSILNIKKFYMRDFYTHYHLLISDPAVWSCILFEVSCCILSSISTISEALYQTWQWSIFGNI